MKKILLLFTAILFVIGITACSASGEAPTDNTLPTNSPTEIPSPGEAVDESNAEKLIDPVGNEPAGIEWADSMEETILVEGMEQTVSLVLYKAKEFVTYIPDTMIAESDSSDGAEDHRFYARYDGNKNDKAYIQVYLFPAEADKLELMAQREKLSLQHLDLEPVNQDEKIHEWSIEEYVVANEAPYSAYVVLGSHEGKYFYMVIHYPWDYGDGFEPVVDKMIEHFYWTDTNTYLVNE